MRFSVIIPLYNKAPYVKKALESVFSQTFRDFELVVVDDGSTDDSLSVAKSVLDGRDIPCQLIPQANSGVSTARNNGVAASLGEYLCFLDADDWWDSRFLEKMDWLIEKYPEAGIYGTNYYYVKNGRHRVCVQSAETGYIDYCKVYAEGMAMPLTSISVALSPQTFHEFGGFKPRLQLGEDFDLWIRIAIRCKVAFLNEPLAFYNQDSNPQWRGIRRLPPPESHMLWNVGYLKDEEVTNPNCKRLLDKLRTYGLFPYYLSREYRKEARDELDKVDWTKQPDKTRLLYRMPIPLLRLREGLLKIGSAIKQLLVR